MPSKSLSIFNSSPEQSIPYEVIPLIFAFFIFIFVFGIILPIGAYIVVNPSFALGAPQTTSLVSAPMSTSHIFSLSASGCFFEDKILAIMKSFKSSFGLVISSTSKPISVRLVATSSRDISVSK